MTMPVFRLVQMFREKQKEVAVVLDEYGGIEGITSMANIITELVGGMASDADVEAPSIVANSDGSWTADGRIAIEDVEEAIDLPALDIESRRGYRTLAGFLMTQAGRIPKAGEVVMVPGYDFRVEAVDGRRIERVRIQHHREPGADIRA